jgi:peroxiredoxin
MEHIPEESLFAAAVCTDPENQDIVQRLAQNLSLSYPILLDTEKKVAAHYQVRILPTTVVLDPQGRITMIKQGYTQAIWQQVRKALERLL